MEKQDEEEKASMVIHYFIAPKIMEDHENEDEDEYEDEDENIISNTFDDLGENMVQE